jgi:hypothetical protein
VPATVSPGQWQSSQAAALAAWTSVPNQSLALTDDGPASARTFGAEDGANNVFFVLSSAEFQQQTLLNPSSVLGVTLPIAGCGSGGVRAPLRDADIIINGTDGSAWLVFDLTTIVTHEVGHAIGLGHPCEDCSDVAVMSAQLRPSGAALTTPGVGDVVGVQALYPPGP